jgi:hypothetical protein
MLKKEKLYWGDILIVVGVLVSNINIYLKTMEVYNNPGVLRPWIWPSGSSCSSWFWKRRDGRSG